MQDEERESMAQDPACGVSSTDSYARYDPDTSSWRTCQGSLFEGWTEYSETFPKSGMMRNGQLSPLPMSAHPISGSGSGSSRGIHRIPTPSVTPENRQANANTKGATSVGEWVQQQEVEKDLWPTPVANDDNKSPEAHMRMKERMKGGPRKKCTSLNVMVKGVEKGLWPTPRAPVRRVHVREGGHHSNLEEVVGEVEAKTMGGIQKWPTPCAHEDRAENYTLETSKRHLKEGRQMYLAQAVRMSDQFPTPSIRDWKGGASAESLEARGKSPNNTSPDQIERQGGQLNPTFVEWLMGYPKDWTDLG
jgi:hypothetical protein